MSPRAAHSLVSVTYIAVCLATPVTRADDSDAARSHHLPERYQVTVLPSLGGSTLGASINNRGWVAGRSTLLGNQSRHATLWRDGVLTDLGTLGGPNSAVLWPVKNNRGVISGFAQSAEPDPNGEAWSCSFFFPAATGRGYRCLGFRWRDGRMTALPTLGGTHGFATGTNNSLRTVGWAENKVVDATCTAPQILQFRAVVWGPDGKVESELSPLGGDSTSAATAINDRGLVIGISGRCDQAAGRFSAIRMVLWERGVPNEIPAFGGVAWNTPMAINQRGEVVGFANASVADDGNFNPRAFYWRKGQATTPLAALPGHATSQATGINERGQIVGQSCDAQGNCRAVAWRGCRVLDLNSLLDVSNDLVLRSANDIDDLGRITGQALDTATGQFVAFVATPYNR
jgi:probable HAF family extracellular repeat protein